MKNKIEDNTITFTKEQAIGLWYNLYHSFINHHVYFDETNEAIRMIKDKFSEEIQSMAKDNPKFWL